MSILDLSETLGLNLNNDLPVSDVQKILRSATHGSTENWVLHGFGRHVVRPWTVPNLGMAHRECELWTGSDMSSSVLELGPSGVWQTQN